MTSLAAMLADVTARASAWPVTLEIRSTEAGHARGEGVPQAHLACGECGQSAFCLSPDMGAGAYAVTGEMLLAGVAAHLRQSHD